MAIDVVSLFKQEVMDVLRSPDVRFLLFGSRARGEEEEYSDYDLLIITGQNESGAKDRIEEIETDIFIRHNAIINSHLFSEEELAGLEFEPFIINALHEGIAA